MWEDEGAWNAYADQGSNYNSDNWWGTGEPSAWSDTQWAGSTGGDPGWGSGWDQTPPPSSGTQGGGSWQQNYTYEPQPYNPQSTQNPYAAQITMGNPTDQEMYRRFGGDNGPEAAMQGAHFYRGQPGFENDPILRNAEHYATSKYALSNPLLNRTGIPQAVTLAGPPMYSLAKLMAQSSPQWLQQYLPQFLTNASPPSWGEVWSGMKPVFGQ